MSPIFLCEPMLLQSVSHRTLATNVGKILPQGVLCSSLGVDHQHKWCCPHNHHQEAKSTFSPILKWRIRWIASMLAGYNTIHPKPVHHCAPKVALRLEKDKPTSCKVAPLQRQQHTIWHTQSFQHLTTHPCCKHIFLDKHHLCYLWKGGVQDGSSRQQTPRTKGSTYQASTNTLAMLFENVRKPCVSGLSSGTPRPVQPKPVLPHIDFFGFPMFRECALVEF